MKWYGSISFRMLCFNPCCPGSASSTISGRSCQGEVRGFQSLLSWIGLLNKDQPAEDSYGLMFQSLLSWIGLLNFRRTRYQFNYWLCFNPCCPGSASSTSSPFPGQLWSACFNPCCPGSASSTFLSRLLLPQQKGFQSLLSWIGLLNHGTYGQFLSAENVSILVVLDRPPQPTKYEPGSILKVGFQSLLSWIGLLNPSECVCTRRGVRVSILVVLDRPPQPIRGPWPATSVRRFNPCCPGSASSTFVCPSPGPSRLMFQSLLSWIGLLNLYPARANDEPSAVSILVVLDRPPQPSCAALRACQLV